VVSNRENCLISRILNGISKRSSVRRVCWKGKDWLRELRKRAKKSRRLLYGSPWRSALGGGRKEEEDKRLKKGTNKPRNLLGTTELHAFRSLIGEEGYRVNGERGDNHSAGGEKVPRTIKNYIKRYSATWLLWKGWRGNPTAPK